MPTTYAHDLFGKKIYHKLPKEMQMVIQRNVNLYRIGLHGPDILFYHMLKPKVSTTGIRMHKEKAALLGFGCHYLLDSACHPYIEDMAAKEVITHTLLEKEFDRTLMLETHKNPYHYYPACGVFPRITYARVIHRAIPKIATGDILKSLRRMKLITNCLVYDNKGRRKKFLTVLSRLAGKKLSDSMMEYFMAKDPVPGSAVPVHALHGLYDREIKEAPQYHIMRTGLHKISYKE